MNDYELKGYLLEGMFKEESKPEKEREESRVSIHFNPVNASFEYDNKTIAYHIVKWLFDNRFICFDGITYGRDGLVVRYLINNYRPVIFQEREKEIRRTSDKWMNEVDFVIIDPDGWDRTNYDYSFYEEAITKEEFDKRLFASTVIGKTKG